MSKEIRAYWDLSFLSEYLSKEQILWGLRVKKFPTFELFDEPLKKNINRYSNRYNNYIKEKGNGSAITGDIGTATSLETTTKHDTVC